MLVFLDAQAQGHLGTSRFYQALDSDSTEASVDGRKESIDAERDFMDAMWSLASQCSGEDVGAMMLPYLYSSPNLA